MREMQIWPLGQEDPLEDMQSSLVFLPGEFHGQRSLAGYRPWGHKELDMTEWLTLSHLLSSGTLSHLPQQINMHPSPPTRAPRSHLQVRFYLPYPVLCFFFPFYTQQQDFIYILYNFGLQCMPSKSLKALIDSAIYCICSLPGLYYL